MKRTLWITRPLSTSIRQSSTIIGRCLVNNNPYTNNGLTLLNLMTALAISSTLAFVGVPSMSVLLSNTQANNAYRSLLSLVQYARIEAVNFHSQVLICPSRDQETCINDWNLPLMVFRDLNDNEARDDDEEILRVKPPANLFERIHWRASGSSRYLRFKPDGATGNQNGRLTYCLQKGEKLYARQIVLYMTGRALKGSQTEAERHC